MKEVSVVQEFDFRQLVFAADGESVTKVFMIAKAYGKCLSDVIPAIEKGHASDEFRAAHFFAVDKINELGIFDKKQKYYRMNLSGFVMLVMGFSGAKAASIKEGDTNVFNWMSGEELRKYSASYEAERNVVMLEYMKEKDVASMSGRLFNRWGGGTKPQLLARIEQIEQHGQIIIPGLPSWRTSGRDVFLPTSPSDNMWQTVKDGGRGGEILFVAAILGLIPAFIASSKGRSFALWWVYGLLLFIVALIHSIFIKRDYAITEQLQMEEGLAKCPFCAEMIKPEAIKCKHCGSDVTARVSRSRALPSPNLGEMDVVVRDAAGNATLNCEAIAAMATELNNKMSNHSAYSIMSTYYPTISRIKERLDEQTGKDFEVALEEAIRFEKRKRWQDNNDLLIGGLLKIAYGWGEWCGTDFWVYVVWRFCGCGERCCK